MELKHTTLPISLVGLMMLAPRASGQDLGDKVILDLVNDAQVLQRASQHELAIIELRRASAILDRRADRKASAPLRKIVDDHLADADPQFKQVARTRESIAKKTLALAKSYRGRGWARVELALLRQAQAMDVEVPVRQLESLRRINSKVFASEESLGGFNAVLIEPADRIDEFDNPGSPWRFLDGVLSSPTITTQSAMVLHERLTHESGVVSVEVNRPAEPGQASLVVGARGRDDFFIFDVQYFEATTAVASVWYWSNDVMQTIGTQEFLVSEKEKGSWVTYEVQIDGSEATFVVAGRRVLSVDCPREPYGRVGFFISETSAYKSSVDFRRLHLQGRIVSADAKADEDEVRGMIAEAEKLIEQREFEDACMELLKARNVLGGLSDDSVRSELASIVTELRTVADPLSKRHLKLDATTVEDLLEIATGYIEVGWHRSAREYILQAVKFDFATAAPQFVANRAEMQLLFAETQGWPAEDPRPVDNARLVEVFKGGEQPLDGVEGWVVDDTGATAPSDRHGDSMILSREPLGGGQGFSIQVLPGAVDRSFGLQFGFDETMSDHLLRFQHSVSTGWTRLESCYRKSGGRYQVQEVKNLHFLPDALAEWMTIQVDFEHNFAKVKVGREPEFRLRTQTAYPEGQIALRSKHVEGQPPLRFRNLVLKN